MRIGVIFPQFEFVTDPALAGAAVRDYAQAAEGLGYSHIGADDHVIGPNPNRPGGWEGWVTYQVPFYEPFVLFSYMAGATQSIEFESCVLLLPQRQTVLVAKQTATLDLLSGGRLRLGIGNGWNQVEYQSLNENFHNRGKRLDEQITLLRKLWTQPLVDFQGQWHTIPDAGINPLPVQRPIPIWFGGHSEAMIRRIARMGDGWMPLFKTPEQARPALETLDRELDALGRKRDSLGLEARVPYGNGDPEEWGRLIRGWQALGATHISLIVTDCGLRTPEQHLAALRRFSEQIGPLRNWTGAHS